jgi:hypothetical protein
MLVVPVFSMFHFLGVLIFSLSITLTNPYCLYAL